MNRNTILAVISLLALALILVFALRACRPPTPGPGPGPVVPVPTPAPVPVPTQNIPEFEDAAAGFAATSSAQQTGSWQARAAVSSRPPALGNASGRQFLLDEINAHAKPPALQPAAQQLTAAQLLSLQRQGTALGFLADNPDSTELNQVSRLLRENKIWETWRATLVLAASGDTQYFSDIKTVLDNNPQGWSAGQSALALGALGDPRAADVLKETIQTSYGTREYNLAQAALIRLGSQGPAQRDAVVDAAIDLISNTPTGTRTIGSHTWQMDHPERLAYIRMTAIVVLRETGNRAAADRLNQLISGLNLSAEDLAYTQQSMAIMRTR